MFAVQNKNAEESEKEGIKKRVKNKWEKNGKEGESLKMILNVPQECYSLEFLAIMTCSTSNAKKIFVKNSLAKNFITICNPSQLFKIF